MTNGRRGASVALAAGVALVVGLGTLAGCGGGTTSAAEQPRMVTATKSAAAKPSPVPTRAGGLPTSAKKVLPVSMRIPDIDVRARINATGVEEKTGDFAVPPSVDEVGWYRFGPGLEATAGSIVIAGHVSSAAQGRGAFYRLKELTKGDRLTVTGSDGVTRTFQVTGRTEYRKTKIPLEKYFARDGKPRLTLITCGGPFDTATRHYRDNIVVTAVGV